MRLSECQCVFHKLGDTRQLGRALTQQQLDEGSIRVRLPRREPTLFPGLDKIYFLLPIVGR